MDVTEHGPCEGQPLTQLWLSGWANVEELFGFRDHFRQSNPGRQLLFVLDSFGQAAYTSMHVCDAYGLLPFPESSDLGLRPDEQKRWEEERVAPERQVSTFVVNAIRSQLPDPFVLSRKSLPFESPSTNFFAYLDDESRIFQSGLCAATVYAEEPSMAIAAFPNGYFASDLSPMQNYLLAETLRAEFGLEIFGLGAFLAGYVRDELFSRDEAERLIERLQSLLYDISQEEASRWIDATEGKRWCFLSYSPRIIE